MNYRHIYHAGNFTEVVKHTVLTVVIDYLRKKEAPFCYIDTHAGEGIYSLTSVEAEKTGESASGVQKIIQAVDYPDCMRPYFEILKPYRTDHKISQYPGSPLFVYPLLREQDRMILNEYHPAIYQRLKQNFAGKPRVAIHQRDAYEFLPAILPPAIPRGVVLIDPPFEHKEEDEKIRRVIEKCLKRWANGIYMIWFPITNVRSWNWQVILSQPGIKEYLVAELTIAAENAPGKGLLGCRLLIINPPWKLAETLSILLNYLWKIFNIDNQGSWSAIGGVPFNGNS